LRRQARRNVRGLESRDPGRRQMPECRRKTWRAGDAAAWLRLSRAPKTAELGTGGGGVASLHRDLHRGVRPRSLHVRKQFSAGQGPVQLSGDLQRVQAYRRALQRGGKDRVVLENGDRRLQAQAGLSSARKQIRERRIAAPGTPRDQDARLAAWRSSAGRMIFFSFRNTRNAKPSHIGWVLRQNASLRTRPSTCHLACAPSLKKITSPAV